MAGTYGAVGDTYGDVGGTYGNLSGVTPVIPDIPGCVDIDITALGSATLTVADIVGDTATITLSILGSVTISLHDCTPATGGTFGSGTFGSGTFGG